MGERLADLRVFGQNQQAVHRIRQAKFLRRTHHALADNAEDLAFLDDEWFVLARLQRQRVVRQDERHFVADLVVLRAANDRALAFAVIDLAHGELVRAGNRVPAEDLRHHDSRELTGDGMDALDFEA